MKTQSKRSVAALASTLLVAVLGCGDVLPPTPAPLFTLPLSIEGKAVSPAIVDTGGGYELMLRTHIDVPRIDHVEVLAVSGAERVAFSRGFDYSVGDLSFNATAALVGLSVCDCNGLGYLFLRRSGQTLMLDFDRLAASLTEHIPRGDVFLPFERPPPALANFDSSFIRVAVSNGSETKWVSGLLDTGTNSTIMRAGLLEREPSPLPARRMNVTISREELGVVAVNVGFFDTPGLPDIILGTDVMRAWGSRWYFEYLPIGGFVHVDLRNPPVAIKPTE